MINVTIDMEQYDCPFVDTSDEFDVAFSATQWEFDRTSNRLETRLVVEGESRPELEGGLRWLDDHENMHDVALLSKRDEVAHIRTTIAQTNAMRIIREHDGYITGPFYIEDGSELWHVGFDNRTIADDTIAGLDRNNEFDVVDEEHVSLPDLQEFIQNADAAMTLIDGVRDLSAVERNTLEAAVSEGYFETPRSATLETLADRFDVSKPAVSKNLRRGQQKVSQHIVSALRQLD
ncbi:helix-turn-helix domain-containing protein [Halobacteriaceae archaeon GCM10025711]